MQPCTTNLWSRYNVHRTGWVRSRHQQVRSSLEDSLQGTGCKEWYTYVRRMRRTQPRTATTRRAVSWMWSSSRWDMSRSRHCTALCRMLKRNREMIGGKISIFKKTCGTSSDNSKSQSTNNKRSPTGPNHYAIIVIIINSVRSLNSHVLILYRA